MFLSDQIHFVTGIAPIADMYNGNPASDWIALKNYGTLTFVVQHAVGTTGTATITVREASDASGTGATAIPFKYRRVAATGTSDVPGALTDATAAGFTTTAGSNQIYLVEVEAQNLSNDKPFVSLLATEVVDSPVAGAVLAVLGEPRYAGDTMLTAIA